MRSLVHKEVPYVWTGDMQVEFENMKKILTSEKFVRPFDPELYSVVFVDSSSENGIGYILVQYKQEDKNRILDKSVRPCHII